MSSFLIKSSKGGISDYEDKGIQGAYKMGINLDNRKKVDSISCNQALIAEGEGVIVDLIRWIVPCTDGNSYGFGSNGKIYKRTSSGTWTVVYTDADGAITGACEWFISNSKTYLFWATDTKLHSKEIPGQSNWSDVDASIVVGSNTYTYPKSNLTSATWHTMVQAVGSLNIANVDWLASVGYDGSYTTQALNIFKKHSVKSMVERGPYVIVGTSVRDNSGKTDLVQWDTTAETFIDRKSIGGSSVNAMIDTDLPLAQVGINGGLFYSDMQNRLPLCTIPGGGYCNPGGVTEDSGLALFGIYGNSDNNNGIYSYGRKKLNQDRTLNLEYYIGPCDEIGSVAKIGTDILVSYRVGSNYYVKKVDTGSKAVAYYYSLDLKAPKKLNYTPTWGPITLDMKALPANCSVEVFYRLDKTGSFVQANLEGGATAFSTQDGEEAIFYVGDAGKIFEVELKLTPHNNDTPEIYSIEVQFQ